MNKHWVPLLALSLAGTCATAQEFKFSGFGTLAATNSSEKRADFIANFAQPNGPGFTRSTDFGVDSRVGLQADLKMGDHFSAVVQAISERRYDDTFTPYLSMAHLKVQLLSGLSIRAGRVPYSAYLISDFQKVGYAQPWVRPPVEVYQFNPLTSVDGADLNWQVNLGDLALSGQLLGGKTTAKLSPSRISPPNPPNSEWEGTNLASASLVAAYGNAAFRVFRLQMDGTFHDAGFDNLFNYIRSLPANQGGSVALADQFQINKDRLIYESVAFQYDPGGWFFMVEETRKRGTENMFLHFTSGYATIGVRMGNWTPYATAGWKHTTSPVTNPNPYINSIVSGLDRGQKSVSAGLRWDFYKNLALKAQYDHVTNATGSWGALTNSQDQSVATATPPYFQPGKSYNLSTLALDFVF
jgi:hypothetical protein